VLAAGAAGAAIGIGLAKLSGNDASGEPALSPTKERTATTVSPTETTSTTTATNRVPRVQIVSAQLGRVSTSTGRALVAIRVRVTNRGTRALTVKKPALLSGEEEVPLRTQARDAAGPLLQPIAPGSSATGVLRFVLPSAVTQRVTAAATTRLRVANRTVVVKLTTDQPSG
jgi:hypothetical protein